MNDMHQKGSPTQSIWIDPQDTANIQIIDQRYLPFQLVIEDLRKPDDFIRAIKDMHVRGAGLIGVTAAFAMYSACIESIKSADAKTYIENFATRLIATRPTAVNLKWAVNIQLKEINPIVSSKEKCQKALEIAKQIATDDEMACKKIGQFGLDILKKTFEEKGRQALQIMTHCNAGWLAFVKHGSATAPLYAAHDKSIPIHVWVSETRPRNQGSRLTAWELSQHGIPHTIIPDNASGHLMQKGLVDMVIVGTDRTTRTGDVANKIGTYMKALAARANQVPFYVALPSSSIDWTIRNGVDEIPIETRSGSEVSHVDGWYKEALASIALVPKQSEVVNFGFDVTPSHMITGLITERGTCEANEKSLLSLFPERS